MYSTVPSPPPAQWNPAQSPSLERTMNTSTSSTPPISPTSPTRRLRGLSYLRSYTQNHILSRDSHHSNNSSSNTSSQQRPSSLARATSYPSPSNRGTPPAPNSVTAQTNLTAPTAQRTTSEFPSSNTGAPNLEDSPGTSGWLPTVGGQSGVSRIPTEPQSTSTSSAAILSGNNSSVTAPERTASMGRTRSATTGAVLDGAESSEGPETPAQNTAVNGGSENKGMSHQLPSIRFSAHQDPRAQRPSLVFGPMARILPTGKETIKVGRYSERENQPVGPPNVPSSAPVGFKSKVVSRRHCEFWCSGGRWYIRDVKSSSGTFLNHIRLSSPGTESRPFPVNDGDIVQLGIDFKGGEEMIFRCVKIRVELNKGWQTGPSQFNVQSHKRLRELNNLNKTSGGSSQDCSICLGPIAPCQSLFVAPCSHTWHYKCIRVIINGPHWPHFICPNCRSVADLEADLDDPATSGEWEELEPEDAVPPPSQPTETEATTTAQLQSQHPIVNPPERAANPVPSDVQGEQHLALTDFERAESEPANDLERQSREISSDLEIEQPGASSDLDIEISDESDAGHAANSLNTSLPTRSNATTAPVDIVPRKAVGSSSSSSRLVQQDARMDRQTTRTPSPNGLASSLDVIAGVEGPMTPRNDVGPFIFDGSAGRTSGARLASVGNSLAAAADTPVEASPNPA